MNQDSLATQYATFRIGNLFFGIDVHQVQEVIRLQELTAVPLAPTTIQGLINLRGQIITAIDLRKRLSLESRPLGEEPMTIVVRLQEETVSFLVDTIGDVIDVDQGQFEHTPESIVPAIRDLTDGVFKLQDSLMLVLSADRAADIRGIL